MKRERRLNISKLHIKKYKEIIEKLNIYMEILR